MLMKKLLLSIVSVFMLFALSAQVSDNFSDYTVGGKLAQQAQDLGRDYWTTWSEAPGSPEDGVIAEMPAGNKALYLTYGNDQLMWCGNQEFGKWILNFKIYIPTGKDGYFNIQSLFTGDQDGVWAFECYMARAKGTPTTQTPGIGNFYAGKATATTFNFAHDTWIPVKIVIDLDEDNAEFYLNATKIYEWQYSKGNNGSGGCPRVIDAFNIFPPTSAGQSSFYIDDVVFEKAQNILYETGFDNGTNGDYVALSDPDWWTTWSDAPGTSEDAKYSNEQASSAPNSAKLVYDNDLIFKAGNKTSGVYTIDFDLYLPGDVPAMFELMQIIDGNNSSWGIDIAINMKNPNDAGFPVGTNLLHNGDLIPFSTPPFNTWVPISMYINLDEDTANLSINGAHIYGWKYSINDEGNQMPRQLAGIDFWPPSATSVYYIDNLKYISLGGSDPTFPILDVTPTSISEQVNQGSSTSITKPITITNSGTSIGEYSTQILFDFAPIPGTTNYNISYTSDFNEIAGYVGYSNGPHVVEIAAKYPSSKYCDKLGTYITKVSYFVSGWSQDDKLTARVYGGGTYNKPGKILAQKTITSPLYMDWNDITLDTPVLLDGQDIWVAFEFVQPVGAHLMSYDDGIAIENSNWERVNGGNWSQLLALDEPIGCWMIQAYTKGTTVPGCWLSLSGDSHGTVKAGKTATYNAVLNPTGLNYGYYPATINILTNDTVNGPLFQIPTSFVVLPTIPTPILTVNPTSINETVTDLSTTITKKVTITNYGNANGTYSASVDADWISLTGNISGTIAGNGEKDKFDVVIDPADLAAGVYTVNITITTNDPNKPTILIPCKITVPAAPKPVLSVTPTLIGEFTESSDIITVPIKITNSGNAPGTYETVVEYEVEGDDWLTFSGAFDGTVAGGTFVTFNALLNPEGLENDNKATIKITTNDELNPLFEIPCSLFVDNSVSEYNIKTLVFPNPATNSVTVQSSRIINSVQIINFVGQTVISANVNKDKTNINTSNLSAGIYFLKVNTDSGSQNLKLIIK